MRQPTPLTEGAQRGAVFLFQERWQAERFCRARLVPRRDHQRRRLQHRLARLEVGRRRLLAALLLLRLLRRGLGGICCCRQVAVIAIAQARRRRELLPRAIC